MKGQNSICKTILGCVCALVLAGVLWGSGEPWKTKPYQQWDEKDVRRILNDSPWSKVIRVDAPWQNGKDGGGGDDDISPGGSQSASPASGGGPAGAGAGASAQGSATPQATYLVRWVSARTIREAAFRGAILIGQLKEEEAEKRLAQPIDVYQILVAGPDMKPFLSIDEGTLKEKSFLVTKKTKQKFSPSQAQIQRSADGKKIAGVLFSFPEKTANGEPTIGADEKGVDFTCSFGEVSIRVSFDISKMDDSKGRDL